MIKKYKNYFLLHLIVFIWGFTALLGKQISLDSVSLVWYRLLIAIITIFIYMKSANVKLKVSRQDFFKFFGIGLLIALHWICFYEAVKASNVSVTLACFATTALFTAFIEPAFFRRRISWIEILSGLIVVVVLSFIFKIEVKYTRGMILSILAALIAATFSVINGILIKNGDSRTISFYELLSGLIGITIYFLITNKFNMDFFTVSNSDWFYLLIMGILCTSFTFIISIEIMKEINPYTVNLTVNLESVYGIIFAYLLFGESERMTPAFYIGAGIIFLTVLMNAVLKRKILK